MVSIMVRTLGPVSNRYPFSSIWEHFPPGIELRSSMEALWPSEAIIRAEVNPPRPAPMTTIFFDEAGKRFQCDRFVGTYPQVG